MLCDTADPLRLTFDLGNDCTSCSQDVHRVESLVFSNDCFKNTKQIRQTFLHQRLKVLHIVCKRTEDTHTHTRGIKNPSIKSSNNASLSDVETGMCQMYKFVEFLLITLECSVVHMVLCCVSMFGCPPRTGGSQLWGSESD